MKQSFYMLILCLFLAACASLNKPKDIMLISKKNNNLQIVIPDNTSPPQVQRFLKEAATCLQRCIYESAQVKLPIVAESMHQPTIPAIFIGKTKYAQNNGIQFRSMDPWEYIIKSVNKNIILAGCDRMGTNTKYKRSYTSYSLGSVKAVTSFLETFLDVQLVLPGPNGISVPKQQCIEIDRQLNISRKPLLLYSTSRSQSMLYDIAMNQFSAGSSNIKLYGGHSYNLAVPTKTYYKTNPEYFAIVKGERYGGRYNHLCISNPDVQEMIYQELLSQCDRGYDIVELGQSDGYRPCECDNCKAMRQNRTIGDVLWHFHLSLANRLEHERPNKKVMIISYGPTVSPPKTIKQFPANVMVELCNLTPEILEKWQHVNVPAGFTTYLYNWGPYHVEGYTPKLPPQAIAEQNKLFAKYKIKGLYKCGYGELFGLEGPIYYLFGKLLEPTDQSPEQLIADYVEATFGAAAPAMKQFYELLYQRLKLDIKRNNAWDELERTGNHQANKTHLQPLLQILILRYPTSTLNKLEVVLQTAEKEAGSDAVKKRLKLVRLEFTYLYTTASIANIYKAYVESPSEKLFNRLASLVSARKKLIINLPAYHNDYLKPMNGIQTFGKGPKSKLLTGGRLNCVFHAPFNWDFNKLQKHGILPGKRHMEALHAATPVVIDGKPNEMIWKQQNGQAFIASSPAADKPFPPTFVKSAWDNKTLYFLLKCLPPEGGNCNEQANSFLVFLSPDSGFKQRKRCRISKKYDFVAIDKFTGFDAKGRPLYKNIAVTKPGTVSISTLDNTLYVEAAIPWSAVNIQPESGKALKGNLTRRRKISTKKYDWQDCIWHSNPAYITWRDTHKKLGSIILK